MERHPGKTPVALLIAFASLGFEIDVDPVVSPDREFMVVCEEAPNGAALVRIFDLDPLSGAPIAVRETRSVLGFARGVDPIIPSAGGPQGASVAVPLQSSNGASAALLVLRVADDGSILEEKTIPLGNLGFAENVDLVVPVNAPAAAPLIAFAALVSPNGEEGLLAVDLDPADSGPVGEAFGSCTLLSSDGRAACGPGIVVNWLSGLTPGVDGIALSCQAMSPSIDRVRLFLPISDGVTADLLRLDFDAATEPPGFLAHASVTAINAGAARPTRFPGFERDVDLVHLLPSECDISDTLLVVPVEGAGEADLYALNMRGQAKWVLSVDSTLGLPIPGYERGVGLLTLCGLQGSYAPRIAVPFETADGVADLWFVSTSDGEVFSRVTDPNINPGLTLSGWQIGVGPVRWDSEHLLLPVQADGGGAAELISIDNDSNVFDVLPLPAGYSFTPSVDLWVAPIADLDRTLVAPIADASSNSADLLFFEAPPLLDSSFSLASANPSLDLQPFVSDVDPGAIDPSQPGSAWIWVAEQSGATAQLRFEPFSGAGTQVAVATSGLNGHQLVVASMSTGVLTLLREDLLGVPPGIDLGSGAGPLAAVDPPAFGAPRPGFDADGDPVVLLQDPSNAQLASPGAVNRPSIDLRFANPFRAPGVIHLDITETAPADVRVLDATGRRIRQLASDLVGPTSTSLVWDARDDRGRPVARGVYFVQVAAGKALRASKLLVVE